LNKHKRVMNVHYGSSRRGAERCEEYLKAVWPIFERYGGENLDAYVPEEALIGEMTADVVFIVEWPSASSFEAFLNDAEFQRVKQMREEAITDSLLVRCRKG